MRESLWNSATYSPTDCPPDTGYEIRALAVWGRARYLSVTEAPHNTDFHTWMGKKHFCFFQTAEAGNRTPSSGVKGSGANHYPRAPAQLCDTLVSDNVSWWLVNTGSVGPSTRHCCCRTLEYCHCRQRCANVGSALLALGRHWHCGSHTVTTLVVSISLSLAVSAVSMPAQRCWRWTDTATALDDRGILAISWISSVCESGSNL